MADVDCPVEEFSKRDDVVSLRILQVLTVYGYMVFLPIYTLPERPQAKSPSLWHWIIAMFLPLVFIFPIVIYAIYRIVIFPIQQIRKRRAKTKQ